MGILPMHIRLYKTFMNRSFRSRFHNAFLIRFPFLISFLLSSFLSSLSFFLLPLLLTRFTMISIKGVFELLHDSNIQLTITIVNRTAQKSRFSLPLERFPTRPFFILVSNKSLQDFIN